MSGVSLLASTSGLLSLMLARVLAPAFYAKQDTKTPVRYGVQSMVSNMIFNAILTYPLGYVGLALSTALSGTVNAVSLFQGLYRRHIYRPGWSTGAFTLRLVIAAVAMGGMLQWAMAPLSVWVHWTQWHAIFELSKLIGIGIATYVVTMAIVGLRLSHFKTESEG